MVTPEKTIIDDIRDMIAEDATPEEYQRLVDSMDEALETVYERRSRVIVEGWEAEHDRRKSIEKSLPVVTPEVLGSLAYGHFKRNVDLLKREGIIK